MAIYKDNHSNIRFTFIKFNRRLSGGTKILRNSLSLTELAKPNSYWKPLGL